VQIDRVILHVEQAGHDFTAHPVILEIGKRADLVVRVVLGMQLAQADGPAVVQHDVLDTACRNRRGDRRAHGDEIEPVHRFVVRADVVVALGRTRMVVERDAGAHDVDECHAAMLHGRLDQRHQLLLVA
jgi:hypothetical protein